MFESDLSDELGQLGHSSSVRTLSFSSETIPYGSAAVDAFIIMACGLAGAISYQLAAGNPIPDLAPQLAVGVLASLFYIVRMSRNGFYHLPRSATPRVEIAEILVSWFVTGLLLALIAFLLKIGGTFSRGSFVAFYFTTPIGLLGMRKLTKAVTAEGISRGLIGRRDVVLLGTPDEILALTPHDLLSICGAADVKRFVLGRENGSEECASADARALDLVVNFARRHNCRQILLALPWTDSNRVELVKDRIKTLPVAAHLLPDVHVRSLTNHSWLSRNGALSIELQTAPLTGAQQFVKREIGRAHV